MSNALTVNSDQVPDYIKQNQSRGSEKVETGDIQYPRIDIIQDLSPQHKESKPEYIPGAKVGMLFNTLTGDLYPEGITVVPVWYDKQHLVWKDQDKGGGLQGVFDNAADAEAKAAEDPDFEAVETPTHLVMLVDDDGRFLMEATIPMSKSKMKINRQWNSLIRLAGGDRFSRTYRVTTVEDSNASNQEYLNYKIGVEGFPSEEVYHAAEALYEAVSSGAIKATASYADQDAGPDSDGEPPADEPQV